MALTMVETYRLKPGRMEDARACFRETKPALVRRGATKVRVLHPEGGGERVNDLLFTWDLEDWHAFAKFRDAFFTSPERDAVIARLTDADAPFEHVSSSFLTDIHDF